jgi:CheY-like chemotaxis protein
MVLAALTGYGQASDRLRAEQAGFDTHFTKPVEPDRRENLWEPVPGDHGAHGTFGDRASESSPQLWASMNRDWLAIAGAGLAGLAVGLLFHRAAEKTTER